MILFLSFSYTLCALNPFLPLQMILAEKGAASPRIQRVRKGDHLAVGICGPVKGPLMSPLWVIKSETFMGTFKSNPIAGTVHCAYTTSDNGWENETAYIAWAQMFVKEIKRRGLKKALLYLDGGHEHFSLIATALLSKANVVVKPTIPSTTHMTQPLDVRFFGGFKKSVAKWFRARGQLPTARDLPAAVENVIASMERRAADAGKCGVLESAFAACHLFPLTEWPDEAFMPSDHLLGLSSQDPRVKAAGTLTEAEVHAVLQRHVTTLTPMTAAALEKSVAEKRAKFLAKGMDLSRCMSLTSEDFLAAQLAKESAAKSAAAGVAERMEKRKADKAAREAEAAAKKAERTFEGIVYPSLPAAKKARALSAAAAAAQEEAAAASAAAALTPPPGAKKKRAASGGDGASAGNPYARLNEGAAAPKRARKE